MTGLKNFSINKKNKPGLKILIGAGILLFLLFILNFVVSPIKNSLYILSSPIQKSFWTAGESSSNFLTSVLDAGYLAQQNNSLKLENQRLLSQVVALQSIKEGNQEQSAVSVACQNSGFKLTMAGVIGLESNDILSINKGSADNIAVGMPVINQQNVLFGKVMKVYKNFSQVMLVSNKNSVVNIKIQSADLTATEIDGVVKGNGGLSAYLDLIPISGSINADDVLVTSAIEKFFPKDLLVGKILQTQKNDQKPFQQAKISLFSDVSSSDNLFVITNYKQAN